MKPRELVGLVLIALLVVALFFYKTTFGELVPFPGELLVSEYKPWQSESFLGYNPGSVPHKAQYPDTLRQLYPWRTLAIRMWKAGQPPLWNPYNFSGAPLLANFQSATLYPLNFLSLILPQVWSWTVLVSLQPLLALIFTYLYCRKLNLGMLASLLAAIAYAFSAFMTVWLEYNSVGQAILWLPLILLATEELRGKFTSCWAIVLTISIAFSLLAGHPQVFFYLFIFGLVYAWFRKRHVKEFSQTACLMLLGLGLTGAQLVPGLELIAQAARSPHPIDIYLSKILIQPWQLLMLMVPDFFGNPATRTYWLGDTYVGKVTAVGLVALIFAVLSLKLLIRENLVRFYAVSAVVILTLITANPLSALLYLWQLPVVSSSSPTLASFILAFSLVVLAAFGVDFWQKKLPKLLPLLTALTPLMLIMATLWLAMVFLPKITNLSWATHLPVGKRSLILETLVLATTVVILAAGATKPKFKSLAVLCLILLEAFDLFVSFRKFNPFVPAALVFPETDVFSFLQEQKTIDRFWGHGAASVQPNFSTQYSLFSPEGYDPLYPKRYGEFIQSSVDGKIETTFTDQTRSDAVVTPSYNDSLSDNPYRLKVLDLLGTNYFLDRSENASTEKSFPPDRFSLISQFGSWKLFKNLKAAPRFFLAAGFETFDNNHDFEKKFFNPSFDVQSVILLEKKLPEILGRPSLSDKVSLLVYRPNEVVFQTTTKESRLLFLSDIKYPGWRALIDGRETEIFRADYAFRSVFVPAGEHRVRFIFQPASFTIGASISLASLAALGVLIIIRRLRGYA